MMPADGGKTIRMPLLTSLGDSIDCDEGVPLCQANPGSSAEQPRLLLPALRGSHALVTARSDGNAVPLYESMGLVRAVKTVPMRICAATEH